jgi:hypothetical protein
MAECIKCRKKYHACGSCGLDFEWEYNYCSLECWETSKEYNAAAVKINTILDHLPKVYWGALEDIMGDDDQYRIFDKIYSKRKNGLDPTPEA